MNPMDALLTMYENLDAENIETVRSLYRHDVKFRDPAHEIHGIEELISYFSSLYREVTTITFSFDDPLVVDSSSYIQWTMTFTHNRLAKKRPISVEGITYVEFDHEGKIFYHRDFFDLGAMIYEHVPLLGRLIQFLKKRLRQ